MENSKAKRFKPNPHCEKFKDDIIKQVMSLAESSLESTEKLNLIRNLTWLEHCNDCSSAQTTEPQKLKAYLEEPMKVCDKSSFDVLLKKNVPHILEKIFLSLDLESLKNCFRVSKAWNSSLRSMTLQKIAIRTYFASIWMDTDKLQKRVYTTKKNLKFWTTNGKEVAYIETVSQKLRVSEIFHFIAEDGEERVVHFPTPIPIDGEFFADDIEFGIWILRHKIIVQADQSVLAIDKKCKQNFSLLFRSPWTEVDRWELFSHFNPDVGVRFLSILYDNGVYRVRLRDVSIGHNSENEWLTEEAEGREVRSEVGCCFSGDSVLQLHDEFKYLEGLGHIVLRIIGEGSHFVLHDGEDGASHGYAVYFLEKEGSKLKASVVLDYIALGDMYREFYAESADQWSDGVVEISAKNIFYVAKGHLNVTDKNGSEVKKIPLDVKDEHGKSLFFQDQDQNSSSQYDTRPYFVESTMIRTDRHLLAFYCAVDVDAECDNIGLVVVNLDTLEAKSATRCKDNNIKLRKTRQQCFKDYTSCDLPRGNIGVLNDYKDFTLVNPSSGDPETIFDSFKTVKFTDMMVYDDSRKMFEVKQGMLLHMSHQKTKTWCFEVTAWKTENLPKALESMFETLESTSDV